MSFRTAASSGLTVETGATVTSDKLADIQHVRFRPKPKAPPRIAKVWKDEVPTPSS